MADIQRRVVMLWDSRGAERVRASIGQVESGFGSLRRNLDLVDRSGGVVDKQLRALGTTLRYTVAGGAVYGTLQMIRTLGEFQAKLGEISSIATDQNGLPIVGSALDDLGRRLIDVSNRTTQPIADLQSGVISLYSTIGDVPENEAANMMERISDVAVTSQSNIEDTTGALLGMLNAFGRGTGEISKFGDEFYRVIQLSAGMPGSIYAQQLGRLSSSAALGSFSPEQMGALAIASTRFGGSPATNMNNLSQMMLYLMNPRSNKEKAALAGIGLGPQQRQQLGGWNTLMKLLQEVNKRGGVGMTSAFATASDDQLQQAIDAGMSPGQMGVSGGGSTLLETAFGRIQSMRIAAILSTMLTPQQVAGTENKTLDEYLQAVSSSAGDTDKAMGRAMDTRRIVQASNAMHNFGIEVGTAIAPLLNSPGGGILRAITGGSGLMNDFNGLDSRIQAASVVGGGTGIALLLRRLSSTARGRALGAIPLAGAGLDTLTGGATRGDSPLNPLYVAVVYNLSGPGGLLGKYGSTYGIPGRDLRTAGEELGAGAGGAAAGRAARSGAARGLARSAAAVTNPVLAGLAAVDIIYGGDWHKVWKDSLIGHVWRGMTGDENNDNPLAPRMNANGRLETTARRGLVANRPSGIDPDKLPTLYGQADVTIRDERTGKVTSVPIDLAPKFTKPAPQNKGRNKTPRGGQ